MRTFFLFLIVCAAFAQNYSTRVLYNPVNEDDVLHRLMKTQNSAEKQHSVETHLMEALKASLTENPTMASSGHILTELHPPVRITTERFTKVRQVPHHSGTIVRRLSALSPLVATAATPDLLWLKIGDKEFVPTRDCSFEFPSEQRSSPVFPVDPPLDVHVASKERVIVRKIPHEKGKPVGFLAHEDHVKVIGVSPDYSYVQIGHSQFIPTTALKVGDPLVPLSPHLTIHIARRTPVYDMPTNAQNSVEGTVVSVLQDGDVVEAIATTTDHDWLKLASGAYVRTEATRMGVPHPATTTFPKPLLVKVHDESVGVVKNPQTPDIVIRTLHKGDQLQTFGVTNDFKWLVVAHHRYIPVISTRLVSNLPKEVPLTPAVSVKLNEDMTLRHIPARDGRAMSRGKRGEAHEASAVTEDFLWVKLGERMWVPLTSVTPRRAAPALRVLRTPVQVTLKEDTATRHRPDFTARKRKTLAAGMVVTAIAATPDAEWLQLGEKEFIPSSSGVLLPVPELAPLTPAISAIVLKDARVHQSPDTHSVVVQRIARGEVVSVTATTTDLKWVKLGENRFVQTELVSHIPALVKLVPAVQFIVATEVKVRNVPAFAGMTIYTAPKGTVVEATETTPDYKWVKIGEGRHVPMSALLLHENEGVENTIQLMKQRSGEAALKAERGGRLTAKSLQPRRASVEVAATTPVSALKLNHAQHEIGRLTVGEYNHLSSPPPSTAPASGLLERTIATDRQPMRQIRVVSDTPVMNAPRSDATQVKTLRKGTLASVFAVDRNMRWLQVGAGEFIPLDNTDVAKQVKQHQL